ncbi:DUF7724 family protein [Bifidobacterium simiarum]|uniref:DUF7724 domain-containing protein n=1 Tax=Bifidobacterium simiarum TaxID=2045441 RepID=A0A2M9HDZ4_9BIFI|nr:hypothetical protein [Bifidobacterium simiarum]MBT1166716.1 hypothetical protein [Bifidobacterium simiarum]PJM75028.1 hypothetical protein CSQ87_07340 [Bifidobacterium simiarum]
MAVLPTAREPGDGIAYLSAENGFTVFEHEGTRIRFRAPYSLEHYTAIKHWDGTGYLVVDAQYQHNDAPEEEYIDLAPILTDLYIDADKFLKPIKKVEIAHA